MSQMIAYLFLSALLLSNASREDETDRKIRVSVSPRNFQLTSKQEVGSVENTALTQVREELQAQPEEQKEVESLSADEVAQQARLATSEASSGMSEISESSLRLRKSLMEMGLGSGLVSSAHKAEARSNLKAIGTASQELLEVSEEMEKEVQKQHAHFTESQAAKVGVSEDEQFAQLEQQTVNIMQWFEHLKHVKKAKEEMQQRRAEAVKEAIAAGLTPEEVQQELAGQPVPSVPAAPKTEPAQAEGDAKADTGVHQSEKRKQLADVMASSAVEMAQIESAATDVMSGLDDFAKWKETEDHSPESLEKAAKVKAKLDTALKFLEEHEGVVDQRTQQINEMMDQANMGHL